MANRLADSTSPYLRQHADNPVHWWEWSEEAFEQARQRNVPVLLSVGYAACHWCHVMAHESFEDTVIAEALNRDFVAVKVDREERPDIDAIYMAATTAMTGHGGWPMTCLLTPEREPFWCGTYLPPADFLRLMEATATAWRDREDQIRAGGAHAAQVLREAHAFAASDAAAEVIGGDDLQAAVLELSRSFDPTAGGFGSAPKFPPSMVLRFLAGHATRTGDERALRMLGNTVEAMARGGMYDQLGGGFARYAVDRDWIVPHFEKMLYDNALLLRTYTAAHVTPGLADTTRDLAGRIAAETAEFLIRDLGTDDGGFASSLDADTDGVEGTTYVWTPEQFTEILGEKDGAWAAELYSVTAQGTFEHGSSTLQLRTDPAREDQQRWQQIKDRLVQARAARPQPERDDKVVTAWNGLAISALAEAGWRFQRPDWIEAASAAATLILDRHIIDGTLHRSSLGGTVSAAPAVAEDHANLIEGLSTLHLATADSRWLDEADALLRQARSSYALEAGGGAAFADTAREAEELLWRPAARSDNAEPCGQSALAGALLAVGGAAGSAELLDWGRRATAPMRSVAQSDPRFAGHALTVAEAATQGPLQVAVSVGAGQQEMLDALRTAAPPGVVAIAAHPEQPGAVAPLLRDRPGQDGAAAAYLCTGTVCDLPRTTPEEVVRSIRPVHLR